MKKRIILLVFFLAIGCVLGMFITDQYMMKNNLPVVFGTWGKKYAPSINKEKDGNKNMGNENNVNQKNEGNEEKTKYKDENDVKLSIYIEQGDNLVKIKEHSCNWWPENVMGLFYAIPSEEENIPTNNFDSMWKEKISTYSNGDKCRIGYNIKFTLNNGEIIDRTILNPDDAYYMFPKVMAFLYDDVNLVPGKQYYHITQDVMYDYTICSSIKLVGDVETDNITSDIELTAFSFDSEDDFDPETKKYRGNSFTTIIIKKK